MSWHAALSWWPTTAAGPATLPCSPEGSTRRSARFARIGFRLRPEQWNRAGAAPVGPCPKLVFAPPPGERASNVHVLEAASEAARSKLLFRDFLRAHDAARDAWGDFKQRLATMAADIYQYGQAKAGPTEILMIAAEDWARQTRWPGTGSRTR